MSPAVDRGNPPEEDYGLSAGSSHPTLVSGQEGWLNYRSDQDRWYWWNGSTWLKIAIDGDNQVTNANLRDSGALSVIGRSANSAGDPADISATAGSDAVLRESGSTVSFGQVVAGGIANQAVTPAKLQDMAGGGPGLMSANASGNAEWRGPANFPGYPLFKDASSVVTFPKISDTGFPSSPVDGQKFTHTSHNYSYFYSSAASGWLSECVLEIPYGNSLDLVSTNFAELDEVAGFQTYSATIGHLFGFAVKVVGISLNMATSGTATVQVTDDGTAIGTSAQLALSGAQSGATETLLSTTIAANSILGVQVTSGTAEGPFRGIVRFRRFET